MAFRARPKILVLGAGFGGLEAAFYLRTRLPEEADITLISDKPYFLFKPNTIYIPFGLDPSKLKVSLDKPAKQRNISFLNARVREIDPITRNVRLEGYKVDQYNFHYDYLVIATGAGMRPEEIPGLAQHANSIWTPEDMLHLRASIRKVQERVKIGERQSILFLVPPNNNSSGPLYEIALMLDTWLTRKSARKDVDIVWSTYESSYIEAFGPRLHEIVSEEFTRRGITGHTDYLVNEVEPGHVTYRNGERLRYDLLVSFPAYVASTPFPALKSDARGFVTTNPETRQALGYPEIYVVGDAGDFPVKQAFLANLQASAAAEHLTSQVLGTYPSHLFEPLSMYVVEQLDKATFAQVPFKATGIAERPIEVQTDAAHLYKVGSSPMWRLGKKLLGVYLPWRYDAGHPFQAGLPGKGMEFGLKAMSNLLAR